MSTERTPVFKYHVFCCGQSRPAGHPRGSCSERGAQPLWEKLYNRFQTEMRPDLSVTMTGCLGFCKYGPLMVVYPEGIWYSPKTPEDIDEIFQSHFIDGKPVERLTVVPERG